MTMRISKQRLVAGAALLAAALPGVPATAQLDGDAMTAARQAAARSDPAEALSRYLRVLSQRPRDLEALTGAGGAALDIGDPDAAIGFFARAEEISPRNGRVKAGIGSALVQKEQARAALKLFDEALDLGVPVADIAADRGLAYDLRGDNRKAQDDYRLAIKARADPEATRRLALSLGISGDRDGALAALDPLLRRQDIPAWRARAFILAMTGDGAGAEQAARAVMPRAQAAALNPFLVRLAGLTPAQKAAAVNFGHFPSDGRTYSSTELFADAATALPPTLPPSASDRSDAGLIPRGAPFGRAGLATPGEERSKAPRRRPGQADPAATTPTLALKAPPPAIASSSAGSTTAGAPAWIGGRLPRKAMFATPAPKSMAVAEVEKKPPASVASASAPQAVNASPNLAVDLSSPPAAVVAMPVITAQSATTGAGVPVENGGGIKITERRVAALAQPPRGGLLSADLLGEDIRAAAQAEATLAPPPAAGVAAAVAPVAQPPRVTAPAKPAVLAPTKVLPAGKALSGKSEMAAADKPGSPVRKGGKATAKEDAVADKKDAAAEKTKDSKSAKGDKNTKAGSDKPAKSKKAERYWVQVAGGANKATLPKAYEQIRAKHPKLLAGRQAWTTPLRFTNRLLVGPFKSADEAQAFVNDSGKAGFQTFSFTSPAGTDVEKLPAK